MRVRAANVNVKLATGLQLVFDHAVERNLAWLVGTGHVYADLEKVAKRNGYLLEVVEVENAEEDFWVAVRDDLPHQQILLNGNDSVAFAAEREDLGEVGIQLDSVTFAPKGDGERLLKIEPTAAIDAPEYEYYECIYTVTANKKES